MRDMNACFPLRYNLQRSGYNFADNEKVFAEMFGANEAFIRETLMQYEEILNNYSKKITDEIGADSLRERLGGKSILFMGDSITSERLSYQKIINKVIRCKCNDEAVSGSRSVDVLINIKNALEKFRPDTVIIMVETNDAQCIDVDSRSVSVSEREYKRNIELITKIAAEYSVRLIYISVPHVHKEKISAITAEYINKYNEILEETVKKYGVELISTQDVFARFSDEALFEPDGIHLSPFGQSELAKEILFYMKVTC